MTKGLVCCLLVLSCCFLPGVTGASGQSQTLFDPMRPADYQRPDAVAPQENKPGSNTASWQLQSTLISATRSIAVINNTAYQKGERLAEYLLTDIQPDRVVLNNGAERVVLHRQGTGTKTPLNR